MDADRYFWFCVDHHLVFTYSTFNTTSPPFPSPFSFSPLFSFPLHFPLPISFPLSYLFPLPFLSLSLSLSFPFPFSCNFRGGDVAILDGTNITRDRRRIISEKISSLRGYDILWIESTSNIKEEVSEQQFEELKNSPDFLDKVQSLELFNFSLRYIQTKLIPNV